MARTDKLPAEPALPRPEKSEQNWLHNLTTRLHSWMRLVIEQVNLLLDGYVLNVTTLPTANETSRSRIVMVRGGGGARDRVYCCLKSDAGAYSWVEFANGGA